MFIATSLNHYKRSQVRDAIVSYALDKEVSVIFNKTTFGKRPDIIAYSQDVLDLAKRKASSFHCSEELWYNPLAITTGMKRHELDDLRKGWDLILDVDCPHWELSKLITHMFVCSLKNHGVQSISAKFSGNKGFHIGIPFQAFPEQVFYEGHVRKTSDLFPELPRKIALYLLSYITDQFISIKENSVVFLDEFEFSFSKLENIAQQSKKTLFAHRCRDCGDQYKGDFNPEPQYVCSSCGHISKPSGSPEFIHCHACNAPVQMHMSKPVCQSCGSTKKPEQFLNLLAVVEIDTVLLASRHLYRMPYSLHEKSGLVSIPVSLTNILDFDKNDAKPENISFNISFMDRHLVSAEQTLHLLQQALSKELSELGHIHSDVNQSIKSSKEIEVPKTAIAEEYFPPCMAYIAKPIEDGKKRALFVLMNFLRVSGWSTEMVEEYVFKWNEGHPEPLREQYVKGQLNQIKKGKKPFPPPNCDNQDYYVSLGFCHPDGFCKRINNPAMYAKKKFELASKKPRKKSKKKVSKK